MARIKNLLRRFLSQRASLGDRSDYANFCDLAGRDERVFADFKRHPVYNQVLEHVTEQQGDAYLEKIRSDYPHLLEFLPQFKENDLYGNPRTCSYGSLGNISPTTLRYVKVLGDLVSLFGALADLDIVEIGGGYGGQCKTISACCGFRSYTLIDLEPCLRLARRYLDTHQIQGIRYRTMRKLNDVDAYGLAISNFAFSECARHVQEVYFKKVLSASSRGYVTCNVIAPEKFDSFTREEFLRRIPGATALPEEPLTHERNFVIVWGTSQQRLDSQGCVGPPKKEEVG